MEDALCGVCAEMCPRVEREMRQRSALVHLLETDAPWSSSAASVSDSSTAEAVGVTASLDRLSLANDASRTSVACGQSRRANPLINQRGANSSNSVRGVNMAGARRRGARRAPPLVANPSRMVKEYARSAADTTIRAENVRPFAALSATVDYLLEAIIGHTFLEGGETLSSSSTLLSRWPIVYAFVADRLRAVRQDTVVQRLPPQETMALLERMLPFYIVAPYLFTADGTPPPSRRCSNGKKAAGGALPSAAITFDWKLHANELDECFSTWKCAVDMLGAGAEQLRAAYLLRHCARADAFALFVEWRADFADESLACRVGAILLAFRMNNFVAFFRAFRSFGVLLRCALLPLVAEMRMSALETLFAAYGAPNVRVAEDALMGWLEYASQHDLHDCLADAFDGGQPANADNCTPNHGVGFHGRRLKTPPTSALAWPERHRRHHSAVGDDGREFGAHWWRVRQALTPPQIVDCAINAPN